MVEQLEMAVSGDYESVFAGMNVFKSAGVAGSWRLYRGPFHVAASQDVGPRVSLTLTGEDAASLAVQMKIADAAIAEYWLQPQQEEDR